MTKRKNKRDEILAATVRLMSGSGLDGLSASAIAAEAGVSKANLYHHFSSIDEIIFESFEIFALGMEMMNPPEKITLREWLIGAGQMSFGMSDELVGYMRGYFMFVAKALFDQKLRARLLGTINDADQVVHRIVAQMADTQTADRYANLIFLTMDSMAIHLMAFPERTEVVAASWSEFVDMIAPLPAGRGGS